MPRATAYSILQDETIQPAKARALLLRLMSPRYDRDALQRSEGWWLRADGSMSLREAVGLLRAWRHHPTGMTPRWYWEMPRLENLVNAKLAKGLNLSPRQVAGILQREDRTLRVPRGPRRLQGHEYLGRFEVQRTLVIADPCYTCSDRADLICTTRARPGRWHAYVRCVAGLHGAAALLVVHADHLDAAQEDGRWFGSFAVDSGRAAIVERDPPEGALDDEWSEDLSGDGMLGRVGCVVGTPYGDGGYVARRSCVAREAVMVRLNLTGEPAHGRFGT